MSPSDGSPKDADRLRTDAGEPLRDRVEVVLIGAGFGGLLTGARLRQAGVEDIRVIDEAGDFGGTWYWNRYPGIPGVETFAGHTFHTSRWDYDYTGGDATGGLEKLADKRVAVIGTGATAIHVVPHLGRDAEHLSVFQRTPSSVDTRDNRPRVGRRADARLAAPPEGELPLGRHRSAGRGGPGRRRLDRQRQAVAEPHPHQRLRGPVTRAA